MATWNTRGLRGSTLEDMVNRTNEKYAEAGLALIPLSVYFKGPRVKLELGLARGKKLYDKREAAARRDAKREIDRTMKTRNR